MQIKSKTKNIYFKEKDIDVYDFLSSQINASEYIISLIRSDMSNVNRLSESENRIVNRIIEYFAGNEMPVLPSIKKVENKDQDENLILDSLAEMGFQID